MGFEVWIVIVLLASGLSGWIGYALAKKDAPKQSDLDAMAAELDEARQQAESVQENVSEHFEQSAMLFGKLAADYREFLDHFESSAQNLGLSEARARELIEQGFQPLLTHEEAAEEVVAEAPVAQGGAEDVLEEPLQKDNVKLAEDEGAGAAQEVTVESETSAEVEPAAAEQTAEVGEVTVELPEEPGVASADEKPVAVDSAESDKVERQRA